MVAVAIGQVQKLVVVGAPSYLERAGRPRQLKDLLDHSCIRQRLSIEGPFLEWRLRAGKERATLDVKGPLVLDDMRAVLGAAREGNGLAYLFEQFASRDLEAATLERVLPGHALVREAFFLYFPTRQKLSPKLRVFVDWFREKNKPTRRRG
jgi:DNA-binding transcriptional LysR family regulator